MGGTIRSLCHINLLSQLNLTYKKKCTKKVENLQIQKYRVQMIKDKKIQETYVGETIRSLCHINSLSQLNLTAWRPYPMFSQRVPQ